MKRNIIILVLSGTMVLFAGCSSANKQADSDNASSGKKETQKVEKKKPEIREFCKPAGKLTDYDGNTYKTVKIGNQVWMSENLRVTHYADGEKIRVIGRNWDKIRNSDKICTYLTKDSLVMKTTGYYYSWNTAVRGNQPTNNAPSGIQGVCPNGWHVPSWTEYKKLIETLGGEDKAGKLLKASPDMMRLLAGKGFSSGKLGPGFSAFSTGMKASFNGRSTRVGESAYFWSTSISYDEQTPKVKDFVTLMLTTNNNNAIKFPMNGPLYGVPVRCVKD